MTGKPCISYQKEVMVPSYINNCLKAKSLLSTMFNSLHSGMNQELVEKHLCNQSSHYKNTDGAACPSYNRLKGKHSLSAIFNCYTEVQIKKSTCVIKVATINGCCAPQYLSESEISIMLLCQLCSTCYTAV